MICTIVGPGALGCMFAAALAKAGVYVWLLDHKQQRAEQINSQGLELIEGNKSSKFSIRAAVDAKSIGTTDLVFLCVKSNDTLRACRHSRALQGDNTLFISLQNGIGHHDLLKRELGDRWAAAVTAQGATLQGVGVVKQGGKGLTVAGFINEVDDGLKNLLNQAAEVFNQAGLQMEISENIIETIWKKLVINTGINALTAINDCPNGELLTRPKAMEKLEKAVLEAVKVAEAKGIKLPSDPVAMTLEICRTTSGNISSMLQDVRNGRLTEIGAINGAIVSEAKKLNIAVPVNEWLVKAVRTIEANAR